MPNSPIIVAYDGTPNAEDALALGSLISDLSGAPLALAHVYRPARPNQRSGAAAIRGRESFMHERAQDLLADGARLLDREVARLPFASSTTTVGLRTLAEREGAQLVIFGSAERTAPGHVHPGSASRRLLQGLGCALGIAPVGFREHAPVGAVRIAVAHDDQAGTARESAQTLVEGAPTAQIAGVGGPAELLLVGSAPNAERGHVKVNAACSQLIQTADTPVIVVGHGRALRLAPISVAAAA